MVNGNCSVVGCTNSQRKIKQWNKLLCSTHNKLNEECPCKQPYKLYCFPSKLRNGDSRARWIRAVNRVSEKKTKWEPGSSDRICSAHFVDGIPTPLNPDPSIKL